MSDADTQKIHNRHAGVLPEPMFEVTAEPSRDVVERTVRSVDQKPCPVCHKSTGLVVTSYSHQAGRRVLAFREHDRVTYGGVRWRCDGSGRQP